MNQYVTGSIIKELRESKKLTQQQLADKLYVSDKTISKWETGKGYPDITLLEPLASELGISVIELMAGKSVINTNKSFNMMKTKFWVCPVCGNIICSTGNTVISCCGILLPSLEVETDDNNHEITIDKSEDEYYVKISHEMTKQHYISFLAYVCDSTVMMFRQYPEWKMQARLPLVRIGRLVWYCTEHGAFYQDIK